MRGSRETTKKGHSCEDQGNAPSHTAISMCFWPVKHSCASSISLFTQLESKWLSLVPVIEKSKGTIFLSIGKYSNWHSWPTEGYFSIGVRVVIWGMEESEESIVRFIDCINESYNWYILISNNDSEERIRQKNTVVVGDSIIKRISLM